jgi:hypothetical protein
MLTHADTATRFLGGFVRVGFGLGSGAGGGYFLKMDFFGRKVEGDCWEGLLVVIIVYFTERGNS